MVHTYEVFVDIKELNEQGANEFRCGTARYEIDAESITKADYMARDQARTDHPRGMEYDIRVTRLLR
jgi:hypothetical protein